MVRVCHKRAGLGLISAVTNKGELRWMVVDGAVKAPTLIRFLQRLIRDAKPQGLPDPGPPAGASRPPGAGLAGRAQRQDRGASTCRPTVPNSTRTRG